MCKKGHRYKRISSKTEIILFLVFLFISSCTQKFFLIDKDLKANSTPLRAEPKGSGFIPTYHFGKYVIISSKPNAIFKKGSKARVTSKGSSEQAISFVLVGNNSDTISVSGSVNTDFRKFGFI